MKFQLYMFAIAIKSQLRRVGFWIFVLLMAALAVLFRFALNDMGSEPAVRIGLINTSGGEAFNRSLLANKSAVIEFVPADRETAEREVSSGRWDCALMLADDYEERLERMEYEKLITVIRGPASALSALVREPVAAAIAERAVQDIALDCLASLDLTEKQLTEVREKLSSGLSEELRVHVLLQTLDGEALDEVNLTRKSISRLMRGTLAISLLVWMLFAAIDLGRWMRSQAARRLLMCRSPSALLLPRIAVNALLTFFVGWMILFSVGETGWRSAAALACYIAVLGALAMLLAVSVRSETVPAVFIPFAAAAGFVLSPVLADISVLFPRLAPLSNALPVTLYLNAGDGSRAAMLQMTVVAALIALIALYVGEHRHRGAFLYK